MLFLLFHVTHVHLVDEPVPALGGHFRLGRVGLVGPHVVVVQGGQHGLHAGLDFRRIVAGAVAGQQKFQHESGHVGAFFKCGATGPCEPPCRQRWRPVFYRVRPWRMGLYGVVGFEGQAVVRCLGFGVDGFDREFYLKIVLHTERHLYRPVSLSARIRWPDRPGRCVWPRPPTCLWRRRPPNTLEVVFLGKQIIRNQLQGYIDHRETGGDPAGPVFVGKRLQLTFRRSRRTEPDAERRHDALLQRQAAVEVADTSAESHQTARTGRLVEIAANAKPRCLGQKMRARRSAVAQQQAVVYVYPGTCGFGAHIARAAD